MMRYRSFFAALAALAVFLPVQFAKAQGVTTSAMTVIVTDSHGAPKTGVRVTAVHVPSGTVYQARTRDDGWATMAGMRIGGPYKVTVASIGFQSESTQDVFLTLGQRSDVDFSLKESAVSARRNSSIPLRTQPGLGLRAARRRSGRHRADAAPADGS